ncbi:DUF7533 family protein [Haloarchaeobius amylolyticus]|uniref:DUF7533 family protein n=1 Tax=Haloarchaeobius amylolyticus TaxID=1198296 RepID=UPI0022706AAE|nr:hypothetical protein [Haloarchaeobius amylolyticus]
MANRLSMGRSIIESVKLLAVLAFALPAIAAGLDMFFLRGETTMGAALVVIGVLMILVEKYIDSPFDLPGKLAGSVVETVVKEPEEIDESTSKSNRE